MTRHYLAGDLEPLCGDQSPPADGSGYVLTPVLDDVDCHACYDSAAVGIATVAAAQRNARLRRALRWLSPVPRLIVSDPTC